MHTTANVNLPVLTVRLLLAGVRWDYSKLATFRVMLVVNVSTMVSYSYKDTDNGKTEKKNG